MARSLFSLWRNVLVEPEDIPRVILPLDLRETREGGRRVRIVDAARAFILKEVDVHARPFWADSLPQRLCPGAVLRRILGGIQPDPDDRHKVAPVAMGERRGVAADARKGAAEAAELDQAERRAG